MALILILACGGPLGNTVPAITSGHPPDSGTLESVPSMSFDPPAPWGLVDDVRSQHHGSVGFAAGGQLVAAWTLGPVDGSAEIWSRIWADPAVAPGQLLQLSVGVPGSKPDVTAFDQGVAVGYQQSAGGIAVERVSVVDLGTEVAQLAGSGLLSTGNNSVSIGSWGSQVSAAWYAGARRGAPAAFVLGGVRGDAVLEPGLVATMDHAYVNTADLAMGATGLVAVAWAHTSTEEPLGAQHTTVFLDRFEADHDWIGSTEIHRAPGSTIWTPRPSVAVTSDGHSIVTYRIRGPHGDVESYLAVIDASGTLLQSDRVSGHRINRPALALLSDQAAILVWEQSHDDLSAEVWAEVVRVPDGQPWLPAFRVSNPGVDAGRADVAAGPLGDGTFRVAVTWEQGAVRQQWGALGRVQL